MLPKERSAGEDMQIARTEGEAIAADELADLMQPAAEIIAQVDWTRGPKILARSLAVRLFVEKHATEIVALSDAILSEAQKKVR